MPAPVDIRRRAGFRGAVGVGVATQTRWRCRPIAAGGWHGLARCFERDAGNCHRYPPSRWRRRASGVFVRCWSTGVAVSVGFGLASPLTHAFAVVVAAVGDRGGAGRRYFPRGDAPTQPWRLTAALASPRP